MIMYLLHPLLIRSDKNELMDIPKGGEKGMHVMDKDSSGELADRND